jgi:hypothetical protein
VSENFGTIKYTVNGIARYTITMINLHCACSVRADQNPNIERGGDVSSVDMQDAGEVSSVPDFCHRAYLHLRRHCLEEYAGTRLLRGLYQTEKTGSDQRISPLDLQ